MRFGPKMRPFCFATMLRIMIQLNIMLQRCAFNARGSSVDELTLHWRVSLESSTSSWVWLSDSLNNSDWTAWQWKIFGYIYIHTYFYCHQFHLSHTHAVFLSAPCNGHDALCSWAICALPALMAAGRSVAEAATTVPNFAVSPLMAAILPAGMRMGSIPSPNVTGFSEVICDFRNRNAQKIGTYLLSETLLRIPNILPLKNWKPSVFFVKTYCFWLLGNQGLTKALILEFCPI